MMMHYYIDCLVDFLNSWSSTSLTTSSSTRCTSSSTSHTSHVRASRCSSSSSVELGDDRVADGLHLLLLRLELVHLRELVLVQPFDRVVALIVDHLFVVARYLVLHLLVLHRCLHVEAVALQSILGGYPLLLLLVLRFELVRIVHHPLDLLLGQPALVVGDRDLVLLSGRLVRCGHVEDAVCVDIERDLDLGNASWSRGDPGEVKLAQVVVPM